MAETPLFVASYRAQQTQFIPGYSTRPRIIWTPGASGSQILRINVATNDAGDNDLQLYLARKVTLQTQMGSGALVDNGGSADTITRSSGSFVTDGWRVGEQIMLQGCTTVANDFADKLTAVAATVLSLATGGGTVDTAETLAAGAALYRLSNIGYVDVPLGSGLPDVAAVSGLDADQMPMLDVSPNRELSIGPNDFLCASFATAMGTGEIGDVVVFGGDF